MTSLKNTFIISFLYKHKLPIAWVAAVVAVVGLGSVYQGKAAMFRGIAEASETIISVPSATEVVKIHVISGQEIHAGDTIVELNRPDLTLRMTELNRELDALEGRSDVNRAEIDRRVAEIKAELASRSSSIRYEISRLETEYQKNKEISAKLKSLSGTGANTAADDAMVMRINSLKSDLSMLQKSANEQIALLRGSSNLQKSSGKAEAENIRKELAQLKKEQDELVQIAKEDWVVGVVNARDGEKLSSFTPIVTLTHKSPTLIRGYINEQVYQRMNLGNYVEVRALSGNDIAVYGTIVGLSSRIVQFPNRLWKMPEMPVYGREVSILISEQNPFLLGEMVTISEIGGMKSLFTELQEMILGEKGFENE